MYFYWFFSTKRIQVFVSFFFFFSFLGVTATHILEPNEFYRKTKRFFLFLELLTVLGELMIEQFIEKVLMGGNMEALGLSPMLRLLLFVESIQYLKVIKRVNLVTL